MKRKKNNEILFFAGVIIVILIIIGMIVLPGKKQNSTTDSNTVDDVNNTVTMTVNEVNVPAIEEPNTPTTPVNQPPTVKLSEVIEAADSWMPSDAHKDFIGKPAPDFTITDIDGKKHTLSQYRGKDVIINLWASWFEPSLAELDTLIQLRPIIGTDKLIVLGVSFDSQVVVKQHVNKQTAINFPIISAATQSLPAPYSTEKPVPCSFFISPDGTLKLSARGTVSLEDYQAILTAE